MANRDPLRDDALRVVAGLTEVELERASAIYVPIYRPMSWRDLSPRAVTLRDVMPARATYSLQDLLAYAARRQALSDTAMQRIKAGFSHRVTDPMDWADLGEATKARLENDGEMRHLLHLALHALDRDNPAAERIEAFLARCVV